MKVLKWTAIIVGGVFGLLVVIGMLIPKEYAERVREERRQQEAEQERAASAPPPGQLPLGRQAPLRLEI